MSLPQCRCIYAIKNKENGKMYIGSTNNLRKRSYEHNSKLKNNYHRNKLLQKDYNEYGKDKFEYKILEEVEESIDLQEKEGCYADLPEYKNKIYNMKRPEYKKVHNQPYRYYNKEKMKKFQRKLAKDNITFQDFVTIMIKDFINGNYQQKKEGETD